VAVGHSFDDLVKLAYEKELDLAKAMISMVDETAFVMLFCCLLYIPISASPVDKKSRLRVGDRQPPLYAPTTLQELEKSIRGSSLV